MQTSEQINEIAAALAKAQGKFPTIEKKKQASVKGIAKASGREYSIAYAYADIADVISAISPILSAEGIAFIQPTVMLDSGMFIATRLMHASGQWIESMYPVCGISGDHQKMGGALTYARRYALCSMVGVAADEDIDGQGAEKPVPKLSKPIERNDAAPPADDFPGDATSKTPAQEYVEHAIAAINNWTGNAVALKQWWDDEKPYREADGVVNPSPEFEQLFEAFKHRGLSLAGKVAPKRAA
jgi:hypothetical protein